MNIVFDSGPSFRSRFSEECLKLGIRVEHSSAYNPSSLSAAERSVQSLKYLLKRSAHMSQLQINECIFAKNSHMAVGVLFRDFFKEMSDMGCLIP